MFTPVEDGKEIWTRRFWRMEYLGEAENSGCVKSLNQLLINLELPERPIQSIAKINESNPQIPGRM
jgi:hypothetical protein